MQQKKPNFYFTAVATIREFLVSNLIGVFDVINNLGTIPKTQKIRKWILELEKLFLTNEISNFLFHCCSGDQKVTCF